ncbi:hypothetical protein FQN54_005516 [Arachnomyces sp. PD_36]|nr:hypothetical protein FQN54_005516 [Arachnomyces sp. PD_36]
MITSSTWLSTARHSLRNAKFAGQDIGLKTPIQRNLKVFCCGYQTTAPRSRSNNKRTQKKKGGSKAEDDFPSETSLDTLFDPEIAGYGGIREYLRKWRASQDVLSLDPIQGPGALGLAAGSKGWVPSMTSDERGGNGEEEILEIEELAGSGEDQEHIYFLHPGDLVKLKPAASGGDGTLAIYVRSIEMQQQFYTIRGKWRMSNNKSLDYLVKSFVPQEMVQPILPYLPDSKIEQQPLFQSSLEGGVPRPSGASLIQSMREFEEKLRDVYRHNSSALDRIYETLAHEEEFLSMSLEEIAVKVLEIEESQLNDHTLLAVHNAIKRQPFYIAAYTDALVSGQYVIRPKKQSRTIDTVVSWVREYLEHTADSSVSKSKATLKQHPLTRFIGKAQRLANLSRKTRSPTTMFNIGPTSQNHDMKNGVTYHKTPIETFTESDRMVLDYLHFWVTQRFLMQNSLLRSVGSHILRATGMYHHIPLTPATGTLFLQELGVFSPWEDMNLLDECLGLPGHGISPRADKMLEDSKILSEQLESHPLEDTMQHLRKDWGDLPVFCVDDVHAEEIDDGFSLERIPGTDSEFWVHVHVANPSAFITPDHLFAKYAAYLNQTVYSPERIYRMFPSSVAKSHFSLGNDRPTITFSAKVNSDGDILDTTVTNGIIRNVMFFTPATLRGLFNIDQSDTPSITLNVGGEIPERTREGMQEAIPEEYHTSLHILRDIAAARLSKRLEKGAMESSFLNRSSVIMSSGDREYEPYTLQSQQGYHYQGDPKIELSGLMVDPFEPIESTKHDLVSHMMLLGGEVAGLWCKDRGIPVMFSGAAYHPEYPPSKLGEGKLSNQYGPRGHLAATPAPHAALGMDQYVKCTSPLRRYSDLQGHWQIEAVLRYEAENGQVNFERELSVLPFTQKGIETMISQSAWRNMTLKKVQNRSNHFWACQLLFRAFYFNETVLPDTFQCVVRTRLDKRFIPTDMSKPQYGGLLHPFGISCVVIPSDDVPDLEIGDHLETKLTLIEMYYQTIVVQASRVIRRDEHGMDPLNPSTTT